MTSIRAAREWLPLHQRLRAMMTKEEVAQVIAYCDENKISYKQRLEELGINPWSFVTGNEKYSTIGNETAAKNVTSVQQNW